MGSRAETILSRTLRPILSSVEVGAELGDFRQLREALTGLNYFLPAILGEVHREWTFMGLDGVVLVAARKTGEGTLEVIGLCYLVRDQALVPLHLHMQLAESAEEIIWLECRIGQRGSSGMVRQSNDAMNARVRRIQRLGWDVEAMDWAYQVTYGTRRP